MHWITRFWNDCRGEVQVSGAMLLVVIVAIGGVAGLTALRDQIVQEFGDISVALERLDQSFTTSCGTYTDTATTLTDPLNGAPADIDLNVDAEGESS